MHCRALAPLAALLALLPGAGAGQQVPSHYRFVDESQSLAVSAGYLFADAGALELGAISAPAFSGRYSIRLNGPFTVEAGITYIPATRAVVDTLRTGPDSTFAVADTAALDLLVATGGLRFDLTGPRAWRGLMPYFLVLGGAVIDISGDDPADEVIPVEARFDFGTSFAGGLGAGVDWFLRPRITLRLDVRDVLWKLETPEALRARDLEAPDSEWVQNFLVSLGASVRF